MKVWKERPFEIRNLFNPAFCGLLLLRSMQGYEEEDENGLPFSLSFLVLPLCLHKDTRDILGANSRRYLLKTVNENPKLLVDFPLRAKGLVPYTLEALGLSMYLGSFKVTDSGRFKMEKRGVKSSYSGTVESVQCQRVAKNIGKKFAQINDRITIYTTFGIKP